MFFVAGTTGHVGGAIARNLLDGGQQVRTLARDPRKARALAERGVDVRPGDLTDAGDLTRALEGVDGAFLLLPPLLAPSPDYREARQAAAAYAEALRRTSPGRLVILSSVGSDRPSGTGNILTTHFLEHEVANLPFPVATLHPGGFIENYVPMLDHVAQTGIFDSFQQPLDRAFPAAATADIGAETARLLTAGWEGKVTVEIGDRVTPQEMARAMGEVLNRDVTARAVPRDAWPKALQAIGLPDGRTALYEEMIDAFNSGWIDWGTTPARHVPASTAPVEVFRRALVGR